MAADINQIVDYANHNIATCQNLLQRFESLSLEEQADQLETCLFHLENIAQLLNILCAINASMNPIFNDILLLKTLFNQLKQQVYIKQTKELENNEITSETFQLSCEQGRMGAPKKIIPVQTLQELVLIGCTQEDVC